MSSNVPPAWYPDPYMPGGTRWWDGNAWTPHVAPGNAAMGRPAEPLGPGGRQFASFWHRAAALLIDGFVLVIPTYLLIFVLARGSISNVFDVQGFNDALVVESNGTTTTSSSSPYEFVDFGALAKLLIVAALVGLVVSGAYYIGTIGVYGRTLGMAALGVRVVDALGAVPGIPRAAKRWLLPAGCSLLGAVPVVGSAASIVLLLDYLSMLWSPQKQCWHDKWAETWVVRTA